MQRPNSSVLGPNKKVSVFTVPLATLKCFGHF